MDEPYAKQVGSIPPCPMENLKAETEYVRANLPGVKTFVKLGNIGTTAHPVTWTSARRACSTAPSR